MMSWKVQVPVLSAAVLAIAVWMAFWPLIAAKNEYSVADETFDSIGKCTAASRVASAWARLGFTENSREWKETAYYLCRYANVKGH